MDFKLKAWMNVICFKWLVKKKPSLHPCTLLLNPDEGFIGDNELSAVRWYSYFHGTILCLLVSSLNCLLLSLGDTEMIFITRYLNINLVGVWLVLSEYIFNFKGTIYKHDDQNVTDIHSLYWHNLHKKKLLHLIIYSRCEKHSSTAFMLKSCQWDRWVTGLWLVQAK